MLAEFHVDHTGYKVNHTINRRVDTPGYNSTKEVLRSIAALPVLVQYMYKKDICELLGAKLKASDSFTTIPFDQMRDEDKEGNNQSYETEPKDMQQL